MKTLIIQTILSFLLSLILGGILIPLLKKLKAGQPILQYVESHKEKSGTPTMGGLFFITSSAIIYLAFNGFTINNGLVALCISLAFMIVGFLDDYLKIRLRHNEGLKAYQKIIFQLSIAIVAGLYCFKNGITDFYLPFVNKSIEFGWWAVPIVAFIFLAITNSVNLTDGLDGLAGSVSVVYLILMVCIIVLQSNESLSVFSQKQDVISLAVCFVGAILGFLTFNVNKASVFMGDTGSLALGGVIGAISIFSRNALIIAVLGFIFVTSALSVIIQVFYFKITKKRVFLMAPFHHHLQLKGYTESKICYLYSIVTVILGMALLICYL